MAMNPPRIISARFKAAARQCDGYRMYEDDHPVRDAEARAFAAASRQQPKWVVSRSL
jgi:hypothetical protein